MSASFRRELRYAARSLGRAREAVRKNDCRVAFRAVIEARAGLSAAYTLVEVGGVDRSQVAKWRAVDAAWTRMMRQVRDSCVRG